MKRFWIYPIGLAALLVPVTVLAAGGDSGFEGIVHSIESTYHVRATRIPFLGLVSLISRKATHGGVSSLHLAEFESFPDAVDGDELNLMVEEKLGPGWERIIRETSKKGTQQTLIFIHPEGNRMGLFVLNKDGAEMDVVQVSIDPDHLNENLDHYSHQRGEKDSEADEKE